MKVLALGDSYTIGEGVSPEERWPEVLADILSNEEIPVDSVQVIAKTGWTTDELLSALLEDEPIPEYDLVTLLIGVNNQYRGLDMDTYSTEFGTCLSKAIHYARGLPHHVCVVSIPDWGVSPFAADRDRKTISKEIDAYNQINKDLARKYNVQYASITPLSRSLCQPEHFTHDGLHPSGEAYHLWAKKIRTTLPL